MPANEIFCRQKSLPQKKIFSGKIFCRPHPYYQGMHFFQLGANFKFYRGKYSDKNPKIEDKIPNVEDKNPIFLPNFSQTCPKQHIFPG